MWVILVYRWYIYRRNTLLVNVIKIINGIYVAFAKLIVDDKFIILLLFLIFFSVMNDPQNLLGPVIGGSVGFLAIIIIVIVVVFIWRRTVNTKQKGTPVSLPDIVRVLSCRSHGVHYFQYDDPKRFQFALCPCHCIHLWMLIVILLYRLDSRCVYECHFVKKMFSMFRCVNS